MQIFTLYAIDSNFYPPNPGLPGGDKGNTTTTISSTIGSIIADVLLPVVGIIAVLFVIIGGIQYMTAGVNEEQAEMGKKTLQNAIIGLVITILSYVIVVVIMRALIDNAV